MIKEGMQSIDDITPEELSKKPSFCLNSAISNSKLELCEARILAPKTLNDDVPLYMFLRMDTTSIDLKKSGFDVGCRRVKIQLEEKGFAVLDYEKLGERHLGLEQKSATKEQIEKVTKTRALAPTVSMELDGTPSAKIFNNSTITETTTKKKTTKNERPVKIKTKNGNGWEIQSTTDDPICGLALNFDQLCLLNKPPDKNVGAIEVFITARQRDLTFNPESKSAKTAVFQSTNEKRIFEILTAKNELRANFDEGHYQGKLVLFHARIQDFECEVADEQ